MTIRSDIFARADSTDDAVRLPALIEMSHSGPCQLNDIEVVGWADERKRHKAIHGVVSRLAGSVIVDCDRRLDDRQFRRSLAAAAGLPWAGPSNRVFGRVRTAMEDGTIRMILVDDAAHLSASSIFTIQNLVHDTRCFAVLASGSRRLFESVWRARRYFEIAAYCRIYDVDVDLPPGLAAYLSELGAQRASLITATEAR